jgi:hypothetical protein
MNTETFKLFSKISKCDNENLEFHAEKFRYLQKSG